MPTVDELPAAAASADSDELLVSQAGVTRKATRAQLLASAQPLIALVSGQLLGRSSGTSGGPQAISIGANLTLSNGILSNSVAPFVIGNLPAGSIPTPTDTVPLAHAGSNIATSYAQFMSGLQGVTGINASAMTARATGGSSTRLLSDMFTNAVAIEDFGALGDGITDDTASLANALAAGQPVRFGPKIYVINGQFTITGGAAALLGIPGQTFIRRTHQDGNGAWFSLQSTSFHADGISFDGNIALSIDSWGVLVTPTCLQADFHRCSFSNMRGPTLGAGIAFQAADPVLTQHAVRDCEAFGNAVHGIWVQALQQVRIEGCRAHDNGTYGICIDYTDPTFTQKLHLCQVNACIAWNNQRGISVGNFNASNTIPPVYGNSNPDASGILITDNVCHDNVVYGIAAAGRSLTIANNTLINNGVGSGAGVLANVAYSRIAGNMVVGNSQYGIDAGGSIMTDIAGNHISGAVHGITPGGSSYVRVSANYIQDCTGWSILVNNVETDGHGLNFGIACANLIIADNWIGFSVAAGGGGILLLDNPQNVRISRNSVVGTGSATIAQALWPHSNSVTIEQNTWNLSSQFQLSGSGSSTGAQIIFPDLLDEAIVGAYPGPVRSVLSMRQQTIAAQIGFIAVASAGNGYTTGSITITGDGSGAAAVAYISGGSIIGVALTNPGIGYTTAAVSIRGDGTGASFFAQIGLPLLDQRRITLRCWTNTIFSYANSLPLQANWTNFDFTVPAYSEVTFCGHNGSWSATAVQLADYLMPDGVGGVVIGTSNGGDLVLRPSGAGHLRITNTSETAGVTTSLGRGAPNGVISAAPGSDYRNLNGGAGSTFWVKQTGTSSTGWIAVA